MKKLNIFIYVIFLFAVILLIMTVLQQKSQLGFMQNKNEICSRTIFSSIVLPIEINRFFEENYYFENYIISNNEKVFLLEEYLETNNHTLIVWSDETTCMQCIEDINVILSTIKEKRFNNILLLTSNSNPRLLSILTEKYKELEVFSIDANTKHLFQISFGQPVITLYDKNVFVSSFSFYKNDKILNKKVLLYIFKE